MMEKVKLSVKVCGAFACAISLTVAAQAESTLATLQRNIDAVQVYDPRNHNHDWRDKTTWSDSQLYVDNQVSKINRTKEGFKPRTDLIGKFGRNGIEIIQEYR